MLAQQRFIRLPGLHHQVARSLQQHGPGVAERMIVAARWGPARRSFGLHSAAAAYSKPGVSETYNRGRPEYDEESVKWLLHKLRLPLADAKVEQARGADKQWGDAAVGLLDLGAGTGKFTKKAVSLLHPGIRGRVAAVEPTQFSAALQAEVPGVAVHRCLAHDLPFEDGSVKAAVAAQAFHWFATRAVADELHRVLAPQARVGLIWNSRDVRVPWVRRLEDKVITPLYASNVPRQQTKAWMTTPREQGGFFDRWQWQHLPSDAPQRSPASSASGFSHISQHLRVMNQLVDESTLTARVMSLSVVAERSQEEQDLIMERIGAFICYDPDLAGKQQWELPYVTETYVFQRVEKA